MMTDVYMYSEIYIPLTNPFKLKKIILFLNFFFTKNKNSDSFTFVVLSRNIEKWM